MISLKISEATEKLQDRLQCLRYLATHAVEVGLTSTASGRSKALLAIHEHGCCLRISVRVTLIGWGTHYRRRRFSSLAA